MSAGRRVARGSIAAGLATWVALAFHLLGGGGMPTPAGIITPFVLSWCACVALAGWRLDSLRLSLSVAVSQVLFHGLFLLGTPTGTTGGGHSHGHAPTLSGDTGAHAAHAMHASPAMGLAHVCAALVTIAALGWGEHALCRLVASLTSLASALGLSLPRPSSSAPPRPLSRPVWPTLATLTDLGRFGPSCAPRGPPRLRDS